jgi:hypothetical protein
VVVRPAFQRRREKFRVIFYAQAARISAITAACSSVQTTERTALVTGLDLSDFGWCPTRVAQDADSVHVACREGRDPVHRRDGKYKVNIKDPEKQGTCPQTAWRTTRRSTPQLTAQLLKERFGESRLFRIRRRSAP